MAVENRLQKVFSSIKGLDLRSSDLLRENGAASEIKNVSYRETGAMNKRKGYHIVTPSKGGSGLISFDNVAVTTGIITEELLCIDDNLHKLVPAQFLINYSGSDSCYYDMYLDKESGLFYFDIYEGSTRVLHKDLGTGKETSFVTIAQLKTDIDAIANFVTAGTSDYTIPAAFLPIDSAASIVASTEVNYNTWRDVPTPGTYVNPFNLHYAQKNSASFENATYVSIGNVIYISNGYDPVHKYDGLYVYKAGLPTATVPTAVANTTGGSFTVGRKIRYKVTTEFTDMKGNFVESNASPYVEITVDASGNGINITPVQLASNSGYCVTTALKYNIWRTDPVADATDTSIYYLINTLDHGAGPVYSDNGTASGAEFVQPIKNHDLPPIGKYMESWRGQLVISGLPNDVTNTYYSDIDSPEYFSLDNTFLVEKKVSGVKPLDNFLYLFSKDVVYAITGDLSTDSVTIDAISKAGIGCVAHNTIREINGALWFLSQNGVYVLGAGQIPEEVSKSISPKFTTINSPFNYSRAYAYHWIDQEQYILLLPITEEAGGNVYNSNLSQIVVYDTFRQAWLEWDKFDISGGVSELDGDIYFIGRESGVTSGTVNNYLKRIQRTGGSEDYADHSDPINFIYKAHWETLGEPSIPKKFLRIKVHSLDGSINDFESNNFTLNVKTEHNFEPVTISDLILDFGDGVIGWGESTWGEFSWGDVRLTSAKSKLNSRRARSIRFIFENNTLQENILITGYTIEYTASYKERIKD